MTWRDLARVLAWAAVGAWLILAAGWIGCGRYLRSFQGPAYGMRILGCRDVQAYDEARMVACLVVDRGGITSSDDISGDVRVWVPLAYLAEHWAQWDEDDRARVCYDSMWSLVSVQPLYGDVQLALQRRQILAERCSHLLIELSFMPIPDDVATPEPTP